MTRRFTVPERVLVALLAAVAALTFFLPLFSIQIPFAGEQPVTGYESASKINQLVQRVRSASGHGEDNQKPSIKLPKMPKGEPGQPGAESQLPVSVRVAWLIPVFIILAFACSLLTLLGSLVSLAVSKWASALGTICGVLALVHLAALNSDIHSVLEDALQKGTGASRNPLAGLAQAIGGALIGNLDLKTGAALYVLSATLALAALLAFSRILSKFSLKVVTTPSKGN